MQGAVLPDVVLSGTDGGVYNISKLGEQKTLFYFYPMTGFPEEPVPQGWDAVPGARGCTVQNCGYRDHHDHFAELGVKVFGVSVQTTEEQQAFADRNHIPFALLSDSGFSWVRASQLLTFEFDGVTMTKRFTLFVDRGRVQKVFYPVFPPDADARTTLSWLRGH